MRAEYAAGCASQQVQATWRLDESLAPVGNRNPMLSNR